MASMYTKLIIDSTGCTPEEAPKVERCMRDTYHTLDGLSKAAFKKEAKLSLAAVRADTDGLWDDPKPVKKYCCEVCGGNHVEEYHTPANV
jgi:hypothetical protein